MIFPKISATAGGIRSEKSQRQGRGTSVYGSESLLTLLVILAIRLLAVPAPPTVPEWATAGALGILLTAAIAEGTSLLLPFFSRKQISMATSNKSLLIHQSRMQRTLGPLFCMSMVGLLVSIVLTGSNPLFPGMSGPLLVLFFFLTAAGSVIGLAVIRSRRATTEATDKR